MRINPYSYKNYTIIYAPLNTFSHLISHSAEVIIVIIIAHLKKGGKIEIIKLLLSEGKAEGSH